MTLPPADDGTPVAPAFDRHHPPDRSLIDACVHCGFCLPSCPTYALWGEEMDSPRGRIYLMKAALDGRADLTPAFVGHFDACLGCMGCVTACPSGVKYGPLIEATRAQIERRHPRTFSDRLFRRALFAVVPYPSRLRIALLPAVLYRAVQPLLLRSGLLNLLPSRLRALAELTPAVTFGGLWSRSASRTPAVGARKLTVGLLTGCVQRLAFGHVNAATIRVLSAVGCDVIAPTAQGCCGALSLHAGRDDEARAFARRTIEVFEDAGVERVVVNAAGCGSSLKELGQLFADDPEWQARAAAFSSRVRDVTEIVAELGLPSALLKPLSLRVAYHDACHLAHAQGIRQQPRDLLAAIPGVELVPFAEPDLCCGSAGIYNLVQPDAARDLGTRKVRHITAAAPDVVATANPGCTIQIAASAERLGRPLRVVHPIELIDASMRDRYFRAAR
jgi:glycolate oxidase iron-sulfur subunit